MYIINCLLEKQIMQVLPRGFAFAAAGPDNGLGKYLGPTKIRGPTKVSKRAYESEDLFLSSTFFLIKRAYIIYKK